MRVAAYLCPNPSLKGATLTDIWGRGYPMKNEPSLELVLCDLPPSNYTVELLSPARLKRSFEVLSEHKTLFLTHHAFADPKLSEVQLRVIRNAKTEELALSLVVHKLSGQVQDFEGHPFPACVWAASDDLNSPQAIVRTDEEGRFALWYAEGKPLRVFVDDESYSRTTYECWIVSEGLKADVQIDPRVGDFELWGLHAWRTQLNWHEYFWPCSLPLDLRAKRLNREFPVPRLRKEEITVRFDGEEVPILGLHRVQVEVGKGKSHPCGPALVQVEVHTAARGRREAWYIVW